MESIVVLMLSVRKLFGFLIPGFTWIVLLTVWAPDAATSASEFVNRRIPVPGVLIVAGLILSYLFGAVSTVVGFRLLEILGDWLDGGLARLGPRGRSRIERFRQRFHLLSARTLAAEIAEAESAVSKLSLPGLLVQPGNENWGLWKMYLLEHAPALAKEAFDIEAEINFTGGMAPPIAAAGVWLALTASLGWGAVLVGIATYLALRFQNLRHHEIVFLAQAYSVARLKKPS